MALVLAVKMGLFLKDFSKCLRQSIAQFPFVLETDFSFRGGLNRNRYKDQPNRTNGHRDMVLQFRAVSHYRKVSHFF